MTEWYDLSGIEERVMRTQTKFPANEWKNLESTIKLMAVQWQSPTQNDDDINVVDWASNQSRDEWFDAQAGWSETFKTGWNFKSLEVWKPGLGHHEGKLRVNIPYEEAMEYNYLYVIMGEQPVPGGDKPRREHFFYFITSLNKVSPNTTELFLELDSWTAYRDSIVIEGINLNRGHYPHALTDATKFLLNPLENHLGLTEAEPDLPVLKPLVASQNLVSFQKNGPRVCIATTADFALPDQFWVNSEDTNTISDPSSVNLPTNQWTESSINNSSTSSLGNNGLAPKPAVGNTKSSITGGLYVFSMSPSAYGGFIMYLRKRFPQALKTIKAVYVLDSVLIEESESIDFYGYSLKSVSAQSSSKLVDTVIFTKDMFGFDTQYADFAKLYTSQFSVVEISNLNGMKAHISIEDVAESIDVYSRASVAFPFLKLEAFLNGVGGKTKQTYAVRPLDAKNAELFNSSWEANIFDMGIPVYGIFAESREVEGVISQIERYRALKNAKLRLAISTLEANTNITNLTSELNKDIANETLRIELDNSNSLDSINKDYTNESLAISASEYSGLSNIALEFNNSSDQITRQFANDSSRVSTEYGNAIESLNTSFNINYSSIDTEATNAQVIANNANYRESWGGINEGYMSGIRNRLTNQTIAGNEIDAMGTSYMSLSSNIDTVFHGNYKLSQYNIVVDTDEMIRQATAGLMSSAANTVAGSFNGASAALGGASSIINSIFAIQNISNKKEAIIRRELGNFAPFNWDTELTLADGSKVNYTDMVSASAIEYDNQKLQLQNEFDRSMYILTNNARASYGDTSSIIDIAVQQAQDFAYYTYEATMRTVNNTKDQGLYNATSNQTLELDIATNNNNLGNAIVNRDQDVSRVITERMRSTNTLVLNNDILTSRTNISNTLNVNTAITARIRNVHTAINTANQVTGLGVINLDYSTALTNINAEFESAIADLSADYNRMVFDEPMQYGDNAGSAWIDSWGHRGIAITVKRISRPSEKLVGNTFALKGYRTEPFWIAKPELSLMTKFTFWQGEARISGNAINETNKTIMRNAFKKGLTIWRDPNEVAIDTDINNNKVGE